MGGLFRRCRKRVEVALRWRSHIIPRHAVAIDAERETRKRETGEKMGPRTSKITAQHEIQYEKAILVVLECVAEIHNEGMIDLKKK